MVNTFIVIDKCGLGIKKSGVEQVDKTMGMWIRDNGYMWYVLFPFNAKPSNRVKSYLRKLNSNLKCPNANRTLLGINKNTSNNI